MASHSHQSQKNARGGFIMPKRSIVKLDWQEAMQQFLFYKRAEGRSERTLSDYKYHITHFFDLYPNCFHDEQQLKKCLYEYLSQPIKPATYNLRWLYNKYWGGKKRKNIALILNACYN